LFLFLHCLVMFFFILSLFCGVLNKEKHHNTM
jgi:preprotein translocase subunit SecG